VLSAPAGVDVRRREVEALGDETTMFRGSEEFDYQGRTYMHVPQDLDVDLRKEVGSITNFIPRKQIHTWKGHTKPVTALRFFPTHGHLLLSGSADSTIKVRKKRAALVPTIRELTLHFHRYGMSTTRENYYATSLATTRLSQIYLSTLAGLNLSADLTTVI